jgi:hypothetical protein
MDHTRKAGPWFHHGLHSGRRPRFTGAHPSGHSGSRQPAAVGGKWRGRHGAAGEWLTGACTAVRRWHTGSGASAQDGDSVVMMRTKRRRVRGVGIFAGAGCHFIGRRRGGGGPGCLHGRH